jgi:hypothetical protein
MEVHMSYDPHEFRVEWRDVAAGWLLSVVAVLGLIALGSGDPASSKDRVQPGYSVETSLSADCDRQACAPERTERLSRDGVALPAAEWEEEHTCGSKGHCAYF